MLTTIKARDVLGMTPGQMLQELPNRVNVIYEDGNKVESSQHKLVYSWFIWEFHRRYPTLKLVHNHHIDSELKGHQLSSNTHIDLLGKITKELILDHGLTSHDQKEEILGTIYYITNQLYNELPKLADRYVMTLDILDIIELANDPEILARKETLDGRPGSIEDFYAAAHKTLLENPKYSANNVVQYIRRRILNINQVNQCLLARGLPIEVTGTILTTPILNSYTTGMFKLYDYVAESRGAAKHLYAAEAPLQQAEYFARRLQLAGTVVKGISERDCGTKDYLIWYVKPARHTDSGRQIYSGDLRFLKGKYYYDELTATLKTIQGNEAHLIGKTIKIRSALYCREPDPHRICPTCFGMLHHNVSRYANLGHLCDATLTHQTTQTLLSTKHHIGSAVGSEINIREDAKRYLTFSPSTMSYYLKPLNKTSKYKMIVNRNTAIGLTDLKLLSNIETINVTRISEIDEIEIHESTGNGVDVMIPVKIEQNKRFGYFSYEFLQYLKEVGWSTNEYDHFVFDLTQWNHKHPVIRVPDMEYSYSDHVDQIADLIESKAKKLNGRVRPDTPPQLLQDLFDLVNSKISVNISLLEVMVYAVMTPGPDNYGLSRNRPEPIVNIARSIIVNRSLSAAYAYEDQFDTLSNPRSFFMEQRPDSPLDVLISPREVVHHLNAVANAYTRH